MQINGPLPPLPAALLNLAPEGATEAWKLGQMLQATAVSGARSGSATLNVNGALLLAQTSLPIQPGQSMQLEVTRLAELALLKILDVSPVPGKGPLTLTLPVPATPDARWQAGQVVKALVIASGGNEGPQPQRTVLDIAGRHVALKVQLPVQAGQTVKLEIIQPGAPAALRVLNTSPTAPAENIRQATRTALPQQIPLPNVLANVAAMARPSPKATPELPPAVLQLAKQIIDRLPTPTAATTPDGLRKAMEQSGVFLESTLAQSIQNPAAVPSTPPPVQGDLKGGLLTLLTTIFSLLKGQALPTTSTTPPPSPQTAQPFAPPLPNMPPQPQGRVPPTITPELTSREMLLELLRHTEGGVARIQLSQLASHHTEDEGRRVWLMEIPLRNGEHVDVLPLRIERDKDGGDKRQPAPWTVTLAFDLENLGPVHARVTLAGGAVSAAFWAQDAETTALFQRHLHELHTRLRGAGLTVGNLAAHRGSAPQAETGDEKIPYVLLDVEA